MYNLELVCRLTQTNSSVSNSVTRSREFEIASWRKEEDEEEVRGRRVKLSTSEERKRKKGKRKEATHVKEQATLTL